MNQEQNNVTATVEQEVTNVVEETTNLSPATPEDKEVLDTALEEAVAEHTEEIGEEPFVPTKEALDTIDKADAEIDAIPLKDCVKELQKCVSKDGTDDTSLETAKAESLGIYKQIRLSALIAPFFFNQHLVEQVKVSVLKVLSTATREGEDEYIDIVQELLSLMEFSTKVISKIFEFLTYAVPPTQHTPDIKDILYKDLLTESAVKDATKEELQAIIRSYDFFERDGNEAFNFATDKITLAKLVELHNVCVYSQQMFNSTPMATMRNIVYKTILEPKFKSNKPFTLTEDDLTEIKNISVDVNLILNHIVMVSEKMAEEAKTKQAEKSE